MMDKSELEGFIALVGAMKVRAAAERRALCQALPWLAGGALALWGYVAWSNALILVAAIWGFIWAARPLIELQWSKGDAPTRSMPRSQILSLVMSAAAYASFGLFLSVNHHWFLIAHGAFWAVAAIPPMIEYSRSIGKGPIQGVLVGQLGSLWILAAFFVYIPLRFLPTLLLRLILGPDLMVVMRGRRPPERR